MEEKKDKQGPEAEGSKEKNTSNVTVSEFMSPDFATVSETSNLRTAIKIMLNQKVSGLPVVNASNFLVGVISEKDLLISASSSSLDNPIKFCKTPNTLKTNTTYKEALLKMLKLNHKWLPVIDENKKILGLVTRAGLLKFLLEN